MPNHHDCISDMTATMGQWQSPLSAALIYGGSSTISFLRLSHYGMFFLVTLPEEDNVQALMFRSNNGELIRVSPTGVNVRSRVHEYGCLPYAFSDNRVFYCDFGDQRLLTQPFDQQTGKAGSAIPLMQTSREDNSLRYGDLLFDGRQQRLICIREQHKEGGVVLNTLVAITVDTPAHESVLFSNADFVASPALSQNGQYLSFISWDHPYMPWDQTQLHLATLDQSGAIKSIRQLEQPVPGALVQPAFSPAGDLFFIADWTDWWNLYRIPVNKLGQDSLSVNDAQAIAASDADICGPMWQPGAVNYTFHNSETVLFTRVQNCLWSIRLCNLETNTAHTVVDGYGALDSLQSLPSGHASLNGRTAVIASPVSEATAIMEVNVREQAAAPNVHSSTRPLYVASPLPTEVTAAMALPRHLRYPTDQGENAYGVYYAPVNPLYSATTDQLPPLLVMVHGGPTSSAKSACNLSVQYWTQRGFAVFDVNHRGSTGYGRHFRQSLYSNWGVHDIADVVAGVEYLISEGLAHPRQLAIRGGSAGGFTVLATLAASDLFSAGTSYYGVSDLSMLAGDTHKFESHYLEQLIGPWPQARHIYESRSPINNIEKIRTPVLMLQGRLDKVVPPNQAEAIFSQIKQNNPASKLIYFDDEAHGFRKPANQVFALEQELAFYQSVLLQYTPQTGD